MKVADGVFQFQIPIPRRNMVEEPGLTETLTYLVEEPEGWVLIDAGWNDDRAFRAFQEQLEGVGVDPRDIRWLVVTHNHMDHMGLATRIREITGARVMVHQRDSRWMARVREGMGDGEGRSSMRKWMLRYGVPLQELGDSLERDHRWEHMMPQVEVDVTVTDRETPIGGSSHLMAVHTPGHTPGHLCVYDSRRRLLFSGDHLLPEITPNISLFPRSRANPLGDYLESLRRIAMLEVDTVMPAHQWVFSNLQQRVEETLLHHQTRLDEMLSALSDGQRTAYQVAASVAWNVGPWQTLSTGTRLAALHETMSHLRLLERRGEVQAVEGEELVMYVRSR